MGGPERQGGLPFVLGFGVIDRRRSLSPSFVVPFARLPYQLFLVRAVSELAFSSSIPFPPGLVLAGLACRRRLGSARLRYLRH